MITAGFDKDKVLAALEGRSGFKQPTKAEFTYTLDAVNTACTTGRYLDDYHALISVVNIRDTQEDEAITSANLNALLTATRKSSIVEAVSAVISEPQMVDSGMLFEPEDNRVPISLSGSKFVGWRINIADGFAMNVNSAVLTFDAAVTFNLYLFHSRKAAPIKTQSVTTVAAGQTIVSLTDWNITSITDTTKGGTFYIGYFQDDIGAANALDYQEHRNCYNAFGALGCEIDGTPNATPALSVVDSTNYSLSGRNYGLNLDVSSYHDYTYRIIRNAHIFDEPIGLITASKVLEMLMMSMRSNVVERMIKNNTQLQALYQDLNMGEQSDEIPRAPGVKNRLKHALKKAKDSFFPKQAITVTHP